MRIFTTGAYLIPKQMPSGNWGWIIDGFEDDSFGENGEYIDIDVWATSENELTIDHNQIGNERL